MSYEEAFAALATGDYRLAVQLLGRAAEETGYASDMINHAYTLALHKAGKRRELGDVAFRVGFEMVAADPASAMDYFQRAIHGGLEAGRVRRIGEIHEEWSGDRRRPRLVGRVTRVGHVVGSLVADQAATRYLKMLTKSLKALDVESTIFTTEGAASWFVNPAAVALTAGSAKGDFDANVSIGSVEGDFLERAERIAETIRNSGIELVLFHGSLSDQISARVAALAPAPVQVNVNHDTEMDADLFDGFIHLTQNALARTRYGAHPSAAIPASSPIERSLRPNHLESRQSLGIASGTVSTSFSGPSRDQGTFVKALIEVLKRFPEHSHLFAGLGEVRSIRGLLHEEGVLSRVRFLGQVSDTARLIDAVDIVFVPFPDAGQTGVLDAMAAGKPVVASRYPANSEWNSAAELIGEGDLTPRNSGEYIQVADRLIRNSESRSKLADTLHERFQQEFRPELLGKRYLEFFERLR